MLDEIFEVNRIYGTRHFSFLDDAMAMDRDRMYRICRVLMESGLNITWSMMTRIDTLNEEMISLAASAGCVQIDYGVESGNPETLRKIHKPHTVEMVRRILRITKEKGIKTYVFFILGFPWEGVNEIELTRK